MEFEKDAVVLERNERLGLLLLGVTVLSAVAGVAQLVLHHGPPLGLYLLSLPLGLWKRATSDNWRARPRSARVRVTAAGVYVDRARVVASNEIAHALVQPRAGQKPTVRLRDKRRNVRFEVVVEDDAEGVELLRLIGHDASAKKARFTTMSPLLATRMRAGVAIAAWMAFATGLPLAVLLLLGFHAAWIPAFVLATLAPVVFFARPREVEVGADGLSVKWLWERRFVPFEQVRAVETPAADGVRVVLASGKHVDLRTGGGGGIGGKERAQMQRDALAQRMREAMEAHRARIGPRELAAHLARGDRDKETWLADLKRLKEGEGGYRAAAVREEDLWRVVEDPGAPEEARAAAAVLLRASDEAKPRLRIAAEAVASPRLRVALESEKEEEIEEVLEEYCVPKRRSG